MYTLANIKYCKVCHNELKCHVNVCHCLSSIISSNSNKIIKKSQ